MINNYVYQQILLFSPFTPTNEQLSALNLLSEFLTSSQENSLLLIKGYAGTGKTSLLGATVRALTKLKQKTILMAPTGRAAKVFSEYAEQKAFTIHKKIYRQKAFSNELTDFSLTGNLSKDTLFIVDEASMIANTPTGTNSFGSGCLLDDLIRYVYSGENCKLILIGDVAQLPPVFQTESPALNADFLCGYQLQIQEINLTEVVRQNHDSGILYNATLIRECLRKSQMDSFPRLYLNSFPDIKKVRGDELIEEISSAYHTDGIDEAIIICRTNKRATAYNNGIRNRILYREEEISSGDRLMIVKNNYFWIPQKEDQTDFIANGEIVEIVRIRRTYKIYDFRFCDATVRFQDYDLELDIRILLDTLQNDSPSLPRELSDKLFFSILEDYTGEKTKADKIKKIKSDPYYNAVQVKYAYAITCHKAQGGQWQNVFLDIGYITEEMMGEDFYRWLYTAITRATKKLYFINLPKEFEADEIKNNVSEH